MNKGQKSFGGKIHSKGQLFILKIKFSAAMFRFYGRQITMAKNAKIYILSYQEQK